MTRERIWKTLEREAARISDIHLRELFAEHENRQQDLNVALDDLAIDFSREKLDLRVLDQLLELAKICKVEENRDALFDGEPINETEGRAVLHMALRGGAFPPDGDDVAGVLGRFLAFADAVRTGKCSAQSGRFTDVLCLGIGGSDLGPVMAVKALAPDCDGPRMHFVSNVDGSHLADTLKNLDPEQTLLIIASKTFTTQETLVNARSARDWFASKVSNVENHLAAVSANVEACVEFGIDASRVFGFWDWVGGRYSIWSAVGLPIAIAIGAKKFREFLAGACAMDKHFHTAKLNSNLPVLLALIGVWRRNFLGYTNVALIPYDQRLARFPAYVQQLEMESNGKRVCKDGSAAQSSTCPVIFGEPGTNSQHSFFQLLHQGSDVVPVDFLLAANARGSIGNHHNLLLANCLAQSKALAFGRIEQEVREEMQLNGFDETTIDYYAPHRTFPGDRPSTTILYRSLDAFSLGRLIALFEHKVFVQGVIWQINSFDQWGVELGKELARMLVPAFEGKGLDGLDNATSHLLDQIRELQS